MSETFTSVFGDSAVPPSGQSYTALSLTGNIVTYWPEYATSDLALADIVDLASTGAFTLTLPDATQVSVGRDLIIRNLSSYTITIHDYLNASTCTLSPGVVKYLYLTDNTTQGGIWGVLTFGTGTSSADAAALAGMGLKALSTTLSQNYETISSTISSSVTSANRASTLVYSSSGSVTCSLPQASSVKNGFFFNCSNQGTGSVIIDPYGSETIDGNLNFTLVPGESAIINCTGVGWVSIGYGRSTQFQFTKLVLDISSGGLFTLTSAQAENKLLQLIGTITGNVEVIVPAVVAIYYLDCSFTGAFHVTVKTASGTGAIGNPTNRIILYCDGVNVVNAQTASIPASAVTGGSAGAILYQVAPDITGFSSAGSVGQVLLSGGAEAPTWGNPTATQTTVTPTGGIVSTNVQAALAELDTETTNRVVQTGATGAAVIPTGNIANRPGVPVEGHFRRNSELGQWEGYDGSQWSGIGGASGGGGNPFCYENDIHITADYTITSGKNAMTAGPIMINDGVTVTIPDGSTWSII